MNVEVQTSTLRKRGNRDNTWKILRTVMFCFVPTIGNQKFTNAQRRKIKQTHKWDHPHICYGFISNASMNTIRHGNTHIFRMIIFFVVSRVSVVRAGHAEYT